ncbi:MAG: TolC family protein [Pseudomonadota bacterium]
MPARPFCNMPFPLMGFRTTLSCQPRFAVCIVALSLLLTGCAINRTEAPVDGVNVTDWETPALSEVARRAQDAAAPLPQSETGWWGQFNDPVLLDLINTARNENREIRIAALRIIEARAQAAGLRANLRPQSFTGTLTGGYAANALAGGRIVDNDFLFVDAGVSAGWEIDIFGRIRRSIEQGDAVLSGIEATARDIEILISAEVARRYYNYRTAEARLAIVRNNAALQQRSTDIANLRYEYGQDSELDAQQARSQLVATETAIPGLMATMEQERAALAVLTGRLPGDIVLDARQEFPVANLPLYAIPADMLMRRPDVRSAVQGIEVQAAQLDLTKAQLQPAFVLAGAFGITRTTAGGLSDAVTESLAGSLSFPIFDFGRIRNAIRAQDARLEQAVARYEQTVLDAARETDTVAINLLRIREEIALLTESAAIARRGLEIATTRYREGLSPFDRVLDAQAVLLRQEDNLTAARGREAVALISLYRVIAGSWEMRAPEEIIPESTLERMQERTNWGDDIIENMAGEEAP